MKKIRLLALFLALLTVLPACQTADEGAAVTTASQTEAITVAPETDEPAEPTATEAPATEPKETASPETASPETAPPETASPETTPPETTPPVTKPKETAPPETTPPVTKPKETTPPETTPPETTPVLEKSKAPKVLTVTYAQDSLLLIIGEAEPGTTLYCRGAATDTEMFCDDGIFRMTVTPSSSNKEMTLSGRQEGKAESDSQVIGYQKLPRRNTDVFPGSDNRLHYSGSISDYLHHNVWDKGHMTNMRNRLEKLQEDIRAVSPDTQLICFIAPNHNSVYGESMPKRYQRQVNGEQSRLDAFTEHMEGSSVIFITPKQYLIERKEGSDKNPYGYPLYQDTDTHWNELGAYYGVEYLLSFIDDRFPDVTKQLSLDNCDVFTKSVPGGDLLNMLGVNLETHREMSVFVRLRQPLSDLNYDKPYRMNFENYWTSDAHVSTKKTDADLPTGMMYRDSFSTNMMIFLSECFSRMDFMSFGSGLSLQSVGKLQPDYVIIERVERNMDGIG